MTSPPVAVTKIMRRSGEGSYTSEGRRKKGNLYNHDVHASALPSICQELAQGQQSLMQMQGVDCRASSFSGTSPALDIALSKISR